MVNPLLKWAGGKRWLVPKLKEMAPQGRLIEPFCGGLAVALGLNPERALLNDTNPHLINLYQQLKTGLERTIGMENDRGVYEAKRAAFNALTLVGGHETPEAAQLFYYLNRNGFNGLCRFNSNGFFNVPFGKYKSVNYPSTADFLQYKEVFAGWEFCRGDFAAIEVADGDWIYADPPYDTEFTSYSAGGFGWTEQIRCAEWLAQQPVPVIVSNQATPRILELYQDLGFTIETLPAPRRIACNGDRAPAMEMLAAKNLPRTF